VSAISLDQEKRTYTARGEFLQGVKDTFPLLVGALPFGLIYGVTAIAGGLSPMAVLGMSLFVYAGSSQFIGANLFAQGTGIFVIVLTTFFVNLRHALYSATLAPHLSHLSQKWLLPLGFWLTDETFAVVSMYTQNHPASPYTHWYQLGSSLAMYLNWQLWTIVGILVGSALQGIQNLGLSFAMVVTFLGIVVTMIKNRAMFICMVVTTLATLLLFPLRSTLLANNVWLIVAAIIGIIAGMIAETQLKSKELV
jgi:4-azaleucine resistance transporter AzlC